MTHPLLVNGWELVCQSGDAYWAESNIGDENAETGAEHINNNSRVWSAAHRVLGVLRGSCEVNTTELSDLRRA